MTISLAFDVYGTMIDTSGVVTALERIIGDQASALSQVWREKQIEYSFRRGLMQNYQDFSVCTEQALDYACLLFGIKITPNQKNSLMDDYKVLPPHSDVEEGLSRLKAAGFRMFAFSNGRADDVQILLKNADIEGYFEGIVSADEVKSYKPNPGVYAHFLRQSKSIGSEAWLISSNSTDLFCQMPLERKDPTFIVDRTGRIHQSKGYTGNLFETFNISQLNQIFDEESCEKILDFSGKERIADNQTLECFSATLQKWFQIQFKPTLDKKHIYVWLIDIGHRKRLDLSLSATRRFSQEVIDNINVLIRNNDVYDRLADLMLKEGFEGIFIAKTTANMNMVGYAFKLTRHGINKSKKITVRNDSPISILMSRKTGKLTYAVKPASLSQSDFEVQYPFDKKVKAFLGFPIVNFLNYHEGEISIIGYNKKQGIATYDQLLMETLVNTARIVSYLMDLAISNNRILNDLETAHETQSQLLPKNDPQIPDLDIAGESIYCDETAGDDYDFFYSNDETGNAFSAVIADVSGHGISAALIMMAARALLKSLVPQTDKPSQIITDLNRLLCQDTLESGNFMTMLFFMIDPVDKSITWVRAGHEPIVCYDPALNQFTELKGSGIAIGLDDEYRYEEFTRDSLADDQIFLVVTDGIWEARNEKGKMLGKDPVKDVIRKHSLESSKVIRDAVIAVVREFMGSAPLEDDLTIIVVKLTCTPQSN